jgi:hypothetical protein
VVAQAISRIEQRLSLQSVVEPMPHMHIVATLMVLFTILVYKFAVVDVHMGIMARQIEIKLVHA